MKIDRYDVSVPRGNPFFEKYKAATRSLAVGQGVNLEDDNGGEDGEDGNEEDNVKDAPEDGKEEEDADDGDNVRRDD